MTKLLYVEDNDDNVFMLKMRLELLGDFEVLTAEDGWADGLQIDVRWGGADIDYIRSSAAELVNSKPAA